MAESLSPSADDAGQSAELVDPARTVRFMLAGNAHVTFQSAKTGTRFTYRVRVAPDREEGQGGPSHFVAVMTGPDNEGSYEYLGCIYRGRAYAHGRKSRIGDDAPSAVAFAWAWSRLVAGKMPPKLAIYHEGRCGACGRRLTTPESISTGLGPVCAGRLR